MPADQLPFRFLPDKLTCHIVILTAKVHQKIEADDPR
jgi:hypothetical protein